MAIKVDLEKAYDRVWWEFVLDNLRDISFLDRFTNLVYDCIASSNMQVLFKDDSTDKFIPSSGLRQGDPLSPYLSVLAMERLSHLIHKAVSEGEWKPIRLSSPFTFILC